MLNIEMRYAELVERSHPPGFQRWFAGSKVVDARGNPLRVFHGTPYGGFEAFNSNKWKGIAGYFHIDPGLSSICAEFPWQMGDKPPATAAEGGACLYPVYLALKNPLDLSRVDGEKHLSAEKFLHLTRLKADPETVRNPLTDQPVWSYLAMPRVIELIKQHGYDGVMYNEQGSAFIAFYPEQVKSVFNRGSFDPSNPNISEAAYSQSMADRAASIVLDWVNQEHRDTASWAQLFASVQPVLDAMKPTKPVKLYRNEKRNDETQYDRFSSWTTDPGMAADYPAGGGRNRQMISAVIDPKDIVCFVPAFGPRIDWLHQQEMIVRPGRYQREAWAPLSEATWHRSMVGKWEGAKPRVFWRGTNPDPEETRRIKTGDTSWDSYLFVADDPQKAQSYGSHLERIIAKPEAKILYQGTREFRKLATGLKGNLLSWASAITTRARAAGYDAVWFEMQGNIGTAIINQDAFERG